MNMIVRIGGEFFSPPQFSGTECSGQVYQKEIKDNYQVLYLKNNSVKKSRLLIYDREKHNIALGDILSVRGEQEPFEEARNPGNFDQKFYYHKQGISTGIWADEIIIIQTGEWRLRNYLWNLRNDWSAKLRLRIGEERGAIVTAMLLGDKAGMDAEIKELYQLNGIGHILAISGLHISVIGISIYKMLRRVTGSYPVGGVGGILFLVTYILLVGLSVSSLRALIMFLLRVGADILGRKYDALTALLAAAVGVIIWRPLALMDGGFWLSFGAVFAVLTLSPVFEKCKCKSFWVNISVNLVLLPVLCINFFEFPLYSVFLNLIVIPLMSLLLILSICSIISPTGFGMIFLINKILELYERLCEWVLHLPGARIVTGDIKVWEVFFYYFFLYKLIKICQKKQKYYLAPIFLFVAVLAFEADIPEREKIEITLVDVGQGDCIYIESPDGETYLIDCGSSNVNNVSRYRVEPFLKAKGKKKLDYVFVTHGDSDHISGIEEMLERKGRGIEIGMLIFPTKMLWDEEIYCLADKAVNKGVKIRVMEAGAVLNDGAFSISCLAPNRGGLLEPGNEASMVLALKYGGFDMLLTGDVEAAGEDMLLKILSQEKKTWEVLKVAHHGSKNSTSERFLDTMQPEYAIISAGENNPYGHPHKETVNRLKNAGCQIYSTKENGAIEITTNGETVEFKGKIKYTFSR